MIELLEIEELDKLSLEEIENFCHKLREEVEFLEKCLEAHVDTELIDYQYMLSLSSYYEKYPTTKKLKETTHMLSNAIYRKNIIKFREELEHYKRYVPTFLSYVEKRLKKN